MKKENRTIIIIEDSSKAKFGGGQRVTLSFLKVFNKFSMKVIMFDTTRNSIFNLAASKYLNKSYNLYAFGKVKSGLFGKIYKLIEILLFPILLIVNCIIVYLAIKNIENKVMYVTTKKSLFIAYCLNYCFKIPFIYHAHLVEKNFIVIFFLNKVLTTAEKVVAVSYTVINSISNCSNIVIIPNSIDVTNRLEHRVLKGKVIVGLFASLIKIKGVDYFIDSYNYLRNKDVYFWIYGEGSEMKKLIGKSNSNIVFKGFTDNTINEMNNYIDVLCFPSVIEESFGISIIEAFSCGIPVITTNIGGQAELVENAKDGYLVPIKSSAAIAEKIDFLIENPSIYIEISENVIQKSKFYNIERIEHEILNVFL